MNIAEIRRAFTDRYTIEREIGHGGMAVVYLARNLERGTDVALKVLRPEFAISVQADRFQREIDILAELEHPSILPLLTSGQADRFIYYAMPYAHGDSLRARLDHRRQLPLADALAVMRDVTAAIDYAHAQNVVHRDIKPENILFEDDRALVCDFGVARALERAGGDDISSSGMVVGTPLYMSPEQAAAERTIDGRTDIYALGAVCYEMLVGEPPFSGVTTQAILARVTKERPPSLGVVRPDVPPHVERAVMAALAKRRKDRPRSGAALLALLTAD